MNETADASYIYHETSGAPGLFAQSSAVQVPRVVSTADLTSNPPRAETTAADAASPLAVAPTK